MDARDAAAMLALAERLSPRISGRDGKAVLGQLEERFPDLGAAMAWFVDAGRTDEALRLAIALYRFWMTKQRFADGAAWFDRALASPGGDDGLRGKACLYGGFMPFWMGDDAAAADCFGRSLEIARRLADRPLVSQALGGLARVALRSDVIEGRRLAREALAVSEAAGDAPHYERLLAVLPEAMGRAAFEEARASGRSMQVLPDAVAIALGGREPG